MSGLYEVSSRIPWYTLMIMFLMQESEADLVWPHLPPAVPGPGAQECEVLPGLQTGNNSLEADGDQSKRPWCYLQDVLRI